MASDHRNGVTFPVPSASTSTRHVPPAHATPSSATAPTGEATAVLATTGPSGPDVKRKAAWAMVTALAADHACGWQEAG